jgi:uncharacterized protein (TIGR02284 family)
MNRLPVHTALLNDLLLIQLDRAVAYERLMRQHQHDESICKLIEEVTMQSRKCVAELRRHIDRNFSDPADRVEIKGEIYNQFPGVKHFVAGANMKDVIVCFECNEHETLSAYQKVLGSEDLPAGHLRDLVYEQWAAIRKTFRYIHSYKELPTAPPTKTEDRVPEVYSRETHFETAWA